MTKGFTLIELMIIVAVIAIIAAIMVPALLNKRIAANEADAITTLENLFSAQVQFRSTCCLDTDNDGNGEYGTFGDLVGLYPRSSPTGELPPLDPPILGGAFRTISNQGVVTKSGYHFRISLPSWHGMGLTEDGKRRPLLQPAGENADAAESMWCCYAWPVAVHATGNRAFFVNQDGSILSTKNDGERPYSGLSGPDPGAAFRTGTDPGSIMGQTASNMEGQDGQVWLSPE